MTEAIEVGWFGPVHGCWAWVQDHFHSVRLLDEHELEDWLEPAKAKGQVSPRILFAVLEHRSDHRIAAVQRAVKPAVKTNAPERDTAERNIAKTNTAKRNTAGATFDTSRVACLLGSDWQGHRRTHPLPENIESFYWFQLFDRTLPWSIRQSAGESLGLDRTRRRTRTKSEPAPHPVAARVQRILDQAGWSREVLAGLASQNLLAWVVTDNLQQRNLWEDVLVRLQVRSVSSRFDAVEPWCQPELIVVDCVAREIDSNDSMRQRIVEIRRNHPNAFLVLVDSFPIWERWHAWIECGVNVLVPRPHQVDGLFIVWQRWLQQRASLSRDIS